MGKRLKKILLIIIIGMLIIPLAQYFTKIVFVKELHGSYLATGKPTYSTNTWFTSDFQNQFDAYYNENFGFRSAFVRLHNQIDYSLFDQIHAHNVILGEQGYLFGKLYVNSYLGHDYIGYESVYSKLNKIEEIYDTLKKHETEMLIIIAPGKGFFYPEYIPASLIITKDTTNYETYINELKKRDIPYIDFNSLFLQMKDTATIILYPKTGIHWSQGIIPYVTDSIIKKVEALLGKDLPDIYWDRENNNIQASKIKTDIDIERSLNLIYPLEIPEMNYPETTFENKKGKSKPNVIAIADSFWWQIFNLGVSERVFDDGSFWYYFKQVYSTRKNKSLMVKDINTKEKVFQSDIIILMTTESNLYKFPFGFENVLKPRKISKTLFNAKVEKTIEYIKTNKKWLAGIRKKAEKRNVSLDSMLYLDATYITKKKLEKENYIIP